VYIKPSLAFLLLLTACAAPTSRPPAVSNAEIQQEAIHQKNLMGEQQLLRNQTAMRERLLQQEQLMRVSASISAAGLKLCPAIKTSVTCAYPFELSPAGERDGLAAFTDDKKITISPSMMRFAKTDTALAIILSHELAHAILGHVQAKQQHALTGKMMGALLDSLAATQGLKSQGEFKKAGEEIGALTYSKEYEREADYVGLYIMALAGYDIKAAPDFWRKISVKEQAIASLSLTHPSNPERAVMLKKTADEIIAKQQHKQPLIPEWQVAVGEVTIPANPYVMQRR
jgi:predicted Zn-dependent protease